MITLKNISKRFDNVQVLKNLNIEIKGGLNFIVGPSGSGKSTLLKIISGMDNDYEGVVAYNGKIIKNFNDEEMNSYYYNSVGFIWQNFQLINHLSVEDNIKVVLELENLSSDEKERKVANILIRLSIEKLAKKSVSTLSGGQKQRVAIARALVKDPEIIIADEPTGALDKKTSNLMMNALSKIAKERTVIVVTHDKSLVTEDSNCFLLKDGTISQLSDGNKVKESLEKIRKVKPSLSIGRAAAQGVKNFKGLFTKFVLTSLILMLASYFLLLSLSGTVVNEQQEILNKLIEEKGDTLRDISLITKVVSAGGTSIENEEGEIQPKLDIEQDVSQVLKKYKNDKRIEYLIPLDIISNMKVTIDDVITDYSVKNSNTSLWVNNVIEGRMPNEEGREVAVSNLFVKNLNLKPEDIIGKNISILGEGYDWTTGEPKLVDIKLENVLVVGVVDTSVEYVSPYGEKSIDELEDSFVYSLDIVREIREQNKKNSDNISFTIRVKDIKDIMDIVEELNKDGLTPMGEFETVQDILRISDSTKEQSSSLTIIIAAIAIVVTLAVTIINGYLRKSEFAILKINGYSKGSIINLNIMEYLLISIVSAIIFLIALPVINNMSKSILDMAVSGFNSTILGLAVVLVLGLVMGIISAFITANINITNNLMSGDR
ncbi:ABC transporter ATP-binding protein/permease [Clostridium sp. D53t1_180928_C8]|uniref:ABC transporter ATP-binding protein/permease n=1 Tax=Clostridium sp. D53t1_180928_C8 TaxID=2787101 RepID=UPI0018AB7940|nr:ABC transporter ATP-binding protein/permease [Clostridium sp. D53t1_180928_C8]